MAVATDGAMTRLMSATGVPAAASAARWLMPGRSEKTDSSTVMSVSQNFTTTQRCRASPQTVPRDSTSPLTSEAKASGRTSQSPKIFIAR